MRRAEPLACASLRHVPYPVVKHIICVGISHHSAPIELREKLALWGDRLKLALDELTSGPLDEAVILNTCNRVEVYGIARHAGTARRELGLYLAGHAAVCDSDWQSKAYEYADIQAVTHLFRVASGLDSMVLGESEILGQVTEALEIARGHGSAGTLLTGVFQRAAAAGRRVRNETGIGRRALSVPAAAVQLARSCVGNLAECNVLVLGAGDMGIQAAKALHGYGPKAIIVSNRSYQRAVELAQVWDGCAVTFDRLPDVLREADVVICSTAAPHPVISREMVERALRSRPERQILLVDIAVPRDVESSVGLIPRARLFDIDDLESIVADNRAARSAEVPAAETIVALEAERCMNWRSSLDVLPTLTALRDHADALREAELERAIRQMTGLTSAQRRVIEAMSRRIVNKLLHAPTVRLKAAARGRDGNEYANALRELFELNGALDNRMPEEPQ
jgi:glutamyl-tRNA reductase